MNDEVPCAGLPDVDASVGDVVQCERDSQVSAICDIERARFFRRLAQEGLVPDGSLSFISAA